MDLRRMGADLVAAQHRQDEREFRESLDPGRQAVYDEIVASCGTVDHRMLFSPSTWEWQAQHMGHGGFAEEPGPGTFLSVVCACGEKHVRDIREDQVFTQDTVDSVRR